MQMNEELIKKIVDAVMEQIGQLDNKTKNEPAAVSSLAGKVGSLAGVGVKTAYSSIINQE